MYFVVLVHNWNTFGENLLSSITAEVDPAVFFRGVPGESSGEGARPLRGGGGSGAFPLKILKIRTSEIPFSAI